jgi:hypothetical protein
LCKRTKLHYALLAILCPLLERKPSIQTLRPNARIDFDKCTHVRHARRGALVDDSLPALQEIPAFESGFGFAGKFHSFCEVATLDLEMSVFWVREEVGFVDVDVRVAEAGC